MQCEVCGTDVPGESKFCPKCGHRLGAAPEVAAANPPASPKDKFRETTNQMTGDGDEAEDELWQGGYSAKAMIGSWLLGFVVSVGLIVAGALAPAAWLFVGIGVGVLWLVLILVVVYRKLSVHYLLTTQRFIHKSGILKRVTDRIEVIDIDDVTFEQGLVERMVGVGTIRINSSDRTHPELALRGIDGVQRIADTIDDVRRKERRRRGLHIETI